MLNINLQIVPDDFTKELNFFECKVSRSDGFYCGSSDLDFYESIPEKRRLEGTHTGYMIGATDTTVSALLKHKQENSNVAINFGCEDTATKFTYLHSRILLSERVRENYAKYKLVKEVPQHSLVLHGEHALAGYQQVAAFNASMSEGYMLLMEQGTGKTPVAIADACNYAHVEGTPTRVLVIAPNNVRMNWESEFNKFATVPFKATVIRGTQVKRIQQLVQALHNEGQTLSVVIMSYDTMVQSWEAVGMIPWDICYLDEAHYIKDARTQRWKYCKMLRDNCKRRRVLTGTPIANSLMDTYTLFEFCGEGYSGFTSFKAFKRYYGVFDASKEKGFEALVSVQNIPAMKDRLSRYSFSITKAEALPDLPEKVYDIIEVEMSPEQQDAYDQLASKLAVEIENELDSSQNTAMTINNVLTKLLKLAQITSGFINVPAVFTDEGIEVQAKKTIHFSPNPKIQALLDLVEEKGKHQKTIVWACFQSDILKIERALQAAGQKVVTYYGATSDAHRQQAEYLFNNDVETKWLIGNPAAGGTGLNLLGYPVGKPQEARTSCDHVIYFSQNWSSIQRGQSEDRAHRRGTLGQVRITDLCVPETIDEMIRARVFDKRRAAMEISDIRELLSNVFKKVRR